MLSVIFRHGLILTRAPLLGKYDVFSFVGSVWLWSDAGLPRLESPLVWSRRKLSLLRRTPWRWAGEQLCWGSQAGAFCSQFLLTSLAPGSVKPC